MGVPLNIYEVPPEFVPREASGPVLAVNTQGVVSFLNEGKKGQPGQPVAPPAYASIPKDDITQFVITRNEPFNEFVVPRKGKPSLLVRTKTVLLKAEHMIDKFGPTGDPQLLINHSTTHSVSEGTQAELLSE